MIVRARNGRPSLADFPRLTSWQRMVAALRLRCPHCGCGAIYARGHHLNPGCPVCGAQFTRAGGEWIGALWLAQTFAALVGLTLWAVAFAYGADTPPVVAGIVAVVVAAAALGYRYIKAWWIWVIYLGGFVFPDEIRPE